MIRGFLFCYLQQLLPVQQSGLSQQEAMAVAAWAVKEANRMVAKANARTLNFMKYLRSRKRCVVRMERMSRRRYL